MSDELQPYPFFVQMPPGVKPKAHLHLTIGEDNKPYLMWSDHVQIPGVAQMIAVACQVYADVLARDIALARGPSVLIPETLEQIA